MATARWEKAALPMVPPRNDPYLRGIERERENEREREEEREREDGLPLPFPYFVKGDSIILSLFVRDIKVRQGGDDSTAPTILLFLHLRSIARSVNCVHCSLRGIFCRGIS